MSFAHLHVHTHYSLLDSTIKIHALMEHVKSLGMNAVAMTDHGNMFGAVEFYKAAKKAGIWDEPKTYVSHMQTVTEYKPAKVHARRP